MVSTLATAALIAIAAWWLGSRAARMAGLLLLVGSLWTLSGSGPAYPHPWVLLVGGLVLWLVGHAHHRARRGWWRSRVAGRVWWALTGRGLPPRPRPTPRRPAPERPPPA
jgi:chromate transport protein ChrA